VASHSGPETGTLLRWPKRAEAARARTPTSARVSTPDDGSLPGASGRLLARISVLPGVYLMSHDADRWQFGLSSEYAFGSSYAFVGASVLLRLARCGAVELNVAPDDRRALLRRGWAIPIPGGLKVIPPTSVSELELAWRIILAAYNFAVGPGSQPVAQIEADPREAFARPRPSISACRHYTHAN
jgi:hypothetical protein